MFNKFKHQIGGDMDAENTRKALLEILVEKDTFCRKQHRFEQVRHGVLRSFACTALSPVARASFSATFVFEQVVFFLTLIPGIIYKLWNFLNLFVA